MKASLYRRDPEAAQRMLARLIPDAEARSAAATLIARVITDVHRRAPQSWELTLKPREVVLNVGQVAVMTVRPREVFTCCAGLRRRPAGSQDFRFEANGVYASVPIASGGVWLSPSRLGATITTISPGLIRFARAAALRKKKSPWRAAHSPALVDVLASLSGRALPQPGYSLPDDEELPEVSPGELARDLEAMREVEQAAIARVSADYRIEGWSVVSREADKVGYDLECKRGRVIRHVEVKGRSGTGDALLLTSREWSRALNDPAWRIAIVSFAGRLNESLLELTGLQLQQQFAAEPIAFRLSRSPPGPNER